MWKISVQLNVENNPALYGFATFGSLINSENLSSKQIQKWTSRDLLMRVCPPLSLVMLSSIGYLCCWPLLRLAISLLKVWFYESQSKSALQSSLFVPSSKLEICLLFAFLWPKFIQLSNWWPNKNKWVLFQKVVNINVNDTVLIFERRRLSSSQGPTWDGRSGVHVHMTNTRITDPEIIERR